MEGLSAAALVPLRLQRRRRVLRGVRPPAARRQVRLRALPLGLPDLHHARSRHSAGRRAGAGGPARGHRERSGRQVHLAQLSPVSGLQGGQPGQRPQHHHAVSARPGGDAGRQDRADPRHGGRPRLRRQQVQPRHPGAAPAGLHLQADRLLRRDRGRVSAVPRDGGRLAQHDRRLARAALDAAELRSRVRRADDVAARALSVAEHHRHQAGHGAGRAGGGQRGGQVRHHAPGCRRAVDPHRLRRCDPAGDDRGLYHLRQPGHPHGAQRHPAGGGSNRQDRVAAHRAKRRGHGQRRTPG